MKSEFVRGLICPKCGSSDNIVRSGHEYSGLFREVKKQKYCCRNCGRIFLESMSGRKYNTKYSTEIVEHALSLFDRGASRKQVIDSVREKFGIIVPADTMGRWSQKFSKRSPDELRDLRARKKVAGTILKTINYEQIARMSGVRQGTVRQIFEALVTSPKPPAYFTDYKGLSLRLGDLRRKVDANLSQLNKLEADFNVSLVRRASFT